MKSEFLRHSRFFQKLANLLFDPSKYFCFVPWGGLVGHTAIEHLMAVRLVHRQEKKLVIIRSPVYEAKNHAVLDSVPSVSQVSKKTFKHLLLRVYLHANHRIDRSLVWLAGLLKRIPGLRWITRRAAYRHIRCGLESIEDGYRVRLTGTENYFDVSLIDDTWAALSLSENQNQAGLRLCDRCGIDPEQKMAVIHVRASASRGSDPGADFRSGSIHNHFRLIEVLIEEGYQVIRIGDPSHTFLSDGIQGFFDLTRQQDDYSLRLAQIYFIASANFYIGSSSGPLSIAQAFDTPGLITEVGDYHAGGFRKNELYLPKHVYDPTKKRYLSVRESWQTFATYPDHRQYVYFGNKPGDIVDAFRDLQQLCLGNYVYEDRKHTREYLKLRKAVLLEQKEKVRELHLVDYFDSFSKIPGQIAPSFIEKYWHQANVDLRE